MPAYLYRVLRTAHRFYAYLRPVRTVAGPYSCCSGSAVAHAPVGYARWDSYLLPQLDSPLLPGFTNRLLPAVTLHRRSHTHLSPGYRTFCHTLLPVLCYTTVGSAVRLHGYPLITVYRVLLPLDGSARVT